MYWFVAAKVIVFAANKRWLRANENKITTELAFNHNYMGNGGNIK